MSGFLLVVCLLQSLAACVLDNLEITSRQDKIFEEP
jgi:hypothetical protein